MNCSITIILDSVNWTMDIDGADVDIYRNGEWAGSAVWDGTELTQCDAPLGDAVYEELNEAIETAATDAEKLAVRVAAGIPAALEAAPSDMLREAMAAFATFTATDEE